MAKIEAGEKVKFTRASDPQTVLTGTVKEVKDDEVLVETEPDGTPVWAHNAHVTVEPEAKK
jgi:erythromycin esterase-like protein